MSGIYLHIPFCRKRCTYCDFHFSTTFESYRADLLAAMLQELELRKDELKEPVQTIYFGGGTPSLLSPTELASIFKCIHAHYQVATAAEITLEANPEDINQEQLEAWKQLGINRLSIGIQTLSSETLNWMNRAHGVQEGLAAIQLAQKVGFSNISIDLIYGLPHGHWQENVQKMIDLEIPHISSYALMVEEKTALHHFVQAKKIIKKNYLVKKVRL